jgi:hypothetical protein
MIVAANRLYFSIQHQLIILCKGDAVFSLGSTTGFYILFTRTSVFI